MAGCAQSRRTDRIECYIKTMKVNSHNLYAHHVLHIMYYYQRNVCVCVYKFRVRRFCRFELVFCFVRLLLCFFFFCVYTRAYAHEMVAAAAGGGERK